MAEKTYPMTLAEKEQLEQELEELKLVGQLQKLLNVLKSLVHTVTFQKTLSTMQPKTNKHLLKAKSKSLKLKSVMLKSLIATL